MYNKFLVRMEEKNMDIKIRQVTMHELNSVANIEEICFSKAEAATRASLEDRIKVFPESFLVAELDGKIVGFINGSVINEKVIRDKFYSNTSFHDSMGDYQSIFGLDVLPEYRARGIAAELIKKLIEVARKAERKGMTLCCKGCASYFATVPVLSRTILCFSSLWISLYFFL